MKQPSYPCSCVSCQKPFSSLGIDTHFMRMHGTRKQKDLFNNATLANKTKATNRQLEYYNNPKHCLECNVIIPYNKQVNDYCSHSCSASMSNRERIKHGYTMPIETRIGISNKLKIYNSKNKTTIISAPYTKVYFKPCKFCNKSFMTTGRARVCKDCQHLKWYNNKDQYSFKFNIFDYPDLFDLSQLTTVGWVSFGGKRGGTKNSKGLSRDHKVSVNHAKLYNYDSYYISHPLNCELMPHTKNNKKKTQSSITYDELVRLVDEYDNRGNH